MGVAGLRPERGLIRLAMVQVAVYDAVNAINGYPFQSYGVTPNVVSPASPEAATATAAHDVLVALFPAQQRTSTQSTRHRLRRSLMVPPRPTASR